MLSRTMFTIEYIHQLRENTGYDPQLLERVIYAFGLLEAIRKVELPFWSRIEQETEISRKDISVSSINLPKAIEMSQYFWMYCLRIFCMKPLGNIR